MLLRMLLVCWSLCFLGSVAGAQNIRLDDVSAETDIDFVHYDGSEGRYYLIEGMSAGVALIDYDGDGDDDIYFLNGAKIGTAATATSASNALYRNDGNFKFTNVTNYANVGDTGFGLGVACGDYNNDGAPDIYVNNYGENVLYQNNADGTFSIITDLAGVANGELVAGGASFFDMDLDGDLDLYVGNYIKFDIAAHRTHILKGLPAYPSPLSFEPEVDTLFRNEGDGRFTNVTEMSGIGSAAGRTMGLVTFDYDADGDIDVFCANDAMENFLFENDGQGNFEEVGLLAGIAYDYKAKPQASMGVAVVDLDGDQLLDLYLTSFSEEFATFYRNEGAGIYEDKTLRSGATEATFPHVTWGVVAADFDNNGTPDIFVGTGDLDDMRHVRGGMSSTTAYHVPNVLLSNDGRGNLTDLGRNWGTGSEIRSSTRGVVAGDLNRDGKLDAIVLNSREGPNILANRSIDKSFLEIRLVGRTSNRDALGAVVHIHSGGWQQTAVVGSGQSYQCEASRTIHFGLGEHESPVTLEIRWPNGKKTSEEVAPSSWTVFVEPK